MEENNKEDKPKYKYDPFTGEYLGGGEEEKAEGAKPDEQSENYFDFEHSSANNGKEDGNNFASVENHYGRSDEQPKQNDVLGIISMVCGILSLLGTCCCGSSVIFGVAAIVLSVLQRRKGNNGFAVAGLVMGIIGIVLGIVMIVVYAFTGAVYDLSYYYPDVTFE